MLLFLLSLLVNPASSLSRPMGVWPRRQLFVLRILCWFFFLCQAFDVKGVSVRSERLSKRSSYFPVWRACTLVLCFAPRPPSKMVVSLPSTSLVQTAWWEFNSLLSFAPSSAGWWGSSYASLSLPSGGISSRNELSGFCLSVSIWGVLAVFHLNKYIFHCSSFFLCWILVFDSRAGKN